MRETLLLESRDYLPSVQMPVAVAERYPQMGFATHTHQFCEIVIVWRGNGLHVLNDRPYRITCGDIFISVPAIATATSRYTIWCWITSSIARIACG